MGEKCKMISVIGHNCIGFINQNVHDSRTEMLKPLALLTDDEEFRKESTDSLMYKKTCDLYNHIINLSKEAEYKRFNLLAEELRLKFGDKTINKYNLLSGEELKYIIDFIDTYGGFKIYY